MDQKKKETAEQTKGKKVQCPHCKNEVTLKEKVVSCQFCGKELDESQFWME